ncbi:MAG: hypothetical protein GF388_06300 [Candidatus Aegiribacteria sp.]|nr:hypothetical protein [Candidatus Aegiribacteria sp.]MBD3294780.1 hypothetical protein [Candidatus Fermentibacteria bacterium]
MRFFTIVTSFILLSPSLARGCSSFACYYENKPLYGMNFDWYPNAEILFDVREGEDGRRIFLMLYKLEGADPVPVAGMNSLGLFSSLQVIDRDTGIRQPQDDEAMIWMPFNMGLWEASDFGEIESQVDSVRLVQYDRIPLHVITAAPDRRAMIIEIGEEGNRTVEIGDDPFIVMTNFSVSESTGLPYDQATGTGADRYISAWESLQSVRGACDIDEALWVLESALNESPEFPTRASMVFDPDDNVVYVAVDGNMEKVWRISLSQRTVSDYRGLPEALWYELPDEGITSQELSLRVEGAGSP